MTSHANGLPGLPCRIHPGRHNCHVLPSAGGKSLQFINTPYISQMMAKPRLNVSFLSYSYPHRLFHPMPCTSSSLSYMYHIHWFLISPSVPASLGTCFSLSVSIESWLNQPKFIHHPKLSPTISHHPLCMWNYPLTTPLFSVYQIPSQLIPSYKVYTFLWKPTNQSSRGIVDDMAIHSPYNVFNVSLLSDSQSQALSP